MTAGPTPSQTAGPFVHLLDEPALVDDHVVAEDHPHGVWLHGVITDGAGAPVDDAMVETWQADAHGRYPGPVDAAAPDGPSAAGAEGFTGFGRCFTDADGRWAVHTVKPGPVPGPTSGPEAGAATQAPHIAVAVLARGLLQRIVTRAYFADEAGANAADPIRARLSAGEAATLTAERDDAGYRFDIRLQGDDATVFFLLR